MVNFDHAREFYKSYETSNTYKILFHRRYINDFELWRVEIASNLKSICSEPSMNNWSEIQDFPSFQRTESMILKACDFKWFESTLHQIWTTQKFKIGKKIIHRCLIRFNFTSVLQKNMFFFHRFAFKNSNLLMQNSFFFQKNQKFLDLKLLFQMGWYQRKNVQFWWLTRRWIAEDLKFLMQCSTISQLCFPLISVEKTLETL